MRGVYWVLAVVLLLVLGFCACAGKPNPREPAQSTTQAARQESVTSGADEAPAAAQAEQPVTEAPTEPTPAETEADVQQSIPQTGMSVPVPQTYTQPAEHPGQVVALTYESRDYAGDGEEIEKTTYVYLPYGYEESGDTRYDILYLMHGWGGSAGEYFFIGNGMIKNVLDHMIENGEIKPMIVVSASFYHDGSDTDFASSVAALRVFHSDFESHLMPAVEGTYRTYAVSASDADLRASRDHRAFGGFSLGSVTTWMQFCYDYDYIRYFLPMSGSCWYYGGFGDFRTEQNVDFIQSLVEENDLDRRGYFIYHAVGTRDSVKEQTLLQAEEMLARPEIFTPAHYVFYQKEGGVHDHNAVMEFLYNALPLFFDSKEFTKQEAPKK